MVHHGPPWSTFGATPPRCWHFCVPSPRLHKVSQKVPFSCMAERSSHRNCAVIIASAARKDKDRLMHTNHMKHIKNTAVQGPKTVEWRMVNCGRFLFPLPINCLACTASSSESWPEKAVAGPGWASLNEKHCLNTLLTPNCFSCQCLAQ